MKTFNTFLSIFAVLCAFLRCKKLTAYRPLRVQILAAANRFADKEEFFMKKGLLLLLAALMLAVMLTACAVTQPYDAEKQRRLPHDQAGRQGHPVRSRKSRRRHLVGDVTTSAAKASPHRGSPGRCVLEGRGSAPPVLPTKPLPAGGAAPRPYNLPRKKVTSIWISNAPSI